MQIVDSETTSITTTVQSSINANRVAGGSLRTGGVASGPLGIDGFGVSGGAGTNPFDVGTLAVAYANSDAAGDDESAETGRSRSGKADALIDLSAVSADGRTLDTPVTGSGNSSLWNGEDGVRETPGDNR